MVSCHDWPPVGFGARATPGVLVVESHPSCCCGRLSWSLWYGCCLSAQGICSVCILCPSENICHHGNSKNCISGQMWRGLVDSLQRCVFHCASSEAPSEPSSAMGVAVPHSWMVLPEGPHAQPALCPCWPRPRCPSPAPPWCQGMGALPTGTLPMGSLPARPRLAPLASGDGGTSRMQHMQMRLHPSSHVAQCWVVTWQPHVMGMVSSGSSLE